MTTAAQQTAQRNRNTIFVEIAEIVGIETFPGDQFTMRIRAPKCAAAARPGNFVHVTCAETLAMRRPLSIMRVEDDCIDILYKIVGDGLYRLSQQHTGKKVSILGPIGQAFKASPERPNTLLIGGGVGIPPMIFLAEFLQQQHADWTPLAILGSELPFPFELQPSALTTPWVSTNINATMPLLEARGIPCRLASLSGFDACFDGYVTGLAELWLSSLDADEIRNVEIFACGPTPMLKAVARLAQKFRLPCQVSLEEFMACAVGGCAGCAVQIDSAKGVAMKRVCVDGPVFQASEVIWNQI